MAQTTSAFAPSLPLAGIHVVVTRPLPQAKRQAELIKKAGGQPILFPAIEILPLHEPAQKKRLDELLARLAEFDFAIFVSPTAVRQALPMMAGYPVQLQFAAVGPGTARALRRGLPGFGGAIIAPDAAGDSEALLALPELRAVAKRRVLVFRGVGGRDLLGETLAQRGAEVEFAECYRRAKPAADVAPLFDAWGRNRLHAITATSSEGLKNLLEMLGDSGRSYLEKTPVFVPHPRIAEAARECGLPQVRLTEAGDEGLLRGLIDWALSGDHGRGAGRGDDSVAEPGAGATDIGAHRRL